MIDEAVPMPNVTSFNGSQYSSISLSAHTDKVLLYFLAFSGGLLILKKGVSVCSVFQEPAPQALHSCFLKRELLGGVIGGWRNVGRH